MIFFPGFRGLAALRIENSVLRPGSRRLEATMTRNQNQRWQSVRVWLLSTGLLLGVGCASPRERPAVEAGRTNAPAALTASVRATNQGELPALTENSVLPDYLAYAALNNPQLEAAFNRWKAALEMVSQARTLPDPKFNYGYFIREVETRVGPQEHRLGLGQTFPWFGKLKLRGEAALQGSQAVEQQYEAARLKLFNEVKQAYYEFYYLGRVIGITDENVVLLREFETVAQAKYQTGTALFADVIKAQVELDKLRDRADTLRDLKSPVMARLNAALNRPANAALPWPQKVPSEHPGVEADQLADWMMAANPELRGLQFQADQEQANLALARKDFYPDVTAALDYTVTGDARMPNVPGSGKDAVLLGFSINLPLWRDKYRAAVRAAENRLTAVQQERLDRGNVLASDLKLALFKLRDAERKIVLYRDNLIPKANENLNATQRSFETGKVDFLNLIDAERVLLEFRLTYERAVADRGQGWATIEKLVGKDLRSLEPKSPATP